MDCRPPGSFSPWDGISQERILEWVAISFSRGSSDPGIEPISRVLADGLFTTEPLVGFIEIFKLSKGSEEGRQRETTQKELG